MAGWLVEETDLVDRAALIDGEHILAAHIVLKGDDRAQLGQVLTARWAEPARLAHGQRTPAALLTSAAGVRLYLPAPPATTRPGGMLTVKVIREAVWTPRSRKLAKVRLTDAAPAAAPSLLQTLPGAVALSRYGDDKLESAGWTELLEEAASGCVERDGVRLWLDTTEAMTLIDVDGTLPPEDLAIAGAELAAQTVLRLDIGGSIGVDFPTLSSKSARMAAATAYDAAMTGAFERTAINGYGFMQVIRPLLRPSILAIMQSEHAQFENARLERRSALTAFRTR